MRYVRVAFAVVLAFWIAAAPSASAACSYWECYVSEHQTSAECRLMLCGGGGDCGKWAESCWVRCDFGCWCNYSYCFDI